jgi:hypothetical protein
MLALAVLAAPGWSDDVTDVDIVTGIDISDSVALADMRAQVDALAAAVRAPDFLAAVRRGRHGRIGFAVFAWHRAQVEILPWTVIGSPAEAEAAARRLEARASQDVESRGREGARFVGRLTDVSRAMDHAAALAASAGTGGRAVINIIGNGRDNMGEPAAPARARLLAAGATVNGVVFGGDPKVADYFGRDVAGGAGSFVIAAGSADSLAEVMHRKLLQDLVAGLGGCGGCPGGER